MARYTYQLVHLPAYFPDTYVLVCHDPDHFSVYDHSGSEPIRPLYAKDFGDVSFREFISSATDKRPQDPHRAADKRFWWPKIESLNRRLGLANGS
jgi:hypothetical protein